MVWFGLVCFSYWLIMVCFGLVWFGMVSILQELKTCFHILQPNYGNKILKVDITFVQMSGTPLKVGPKLAGTLGPLLPTGRHQKWV